MSAVKSQRAAEAGRTRQQPQYRIAYRPMRQGSNGNGAVPPLDRQYHGHARMIRISFEVREEHAPALRSAVEEISNEIGGRLEGPHAFAKEEALTNAAIALGALRAAVNAKVPAGDPYYA